MTSQVKPLRRALAATFLLLAMACSGRADPDAQTILRDARMAQTGQQRTLTGHLRVESTGQIIPFTLELAGGTIRYQFQDKDIILRLGENGSQLMEAAHGETEKVSPARYDKPVEGTDITYEDLSLKFLYWPIARIDGSETIDALNCWKLHLQPGGQPSAYASVELWVRKLSDDFLKGEGCDAAGNLVKRFKVISGQRDPQGGWMLKKMRIETLPPGKPESITYLEIDK
ncbi:MAG: outer membrane lipoprotein-sorting protein [Chthoniobacteraceae bacterium]|jgi:hypothetical protein